MSKKKAVKKVAPKKVAPKKAEKTPEPKKPEPSGKVIGSLIVNFYENGFNVDIHECSAKMLMLAIEEIVTRYIMNPGNK